VGSPFHATAVGSLLEPMILHLSGARKVGSRRIYNSGKARSAPSGLSSPLKDSSFRQHFPGKIYSEALFKMLFIIYLALVGGAWQSVICRRFIDFVSRPHPDGRPFLVQPADQQLVISQRSPFPKIGLPVILGSLIFRNGGRCDLGATLWLST